MQFPFKLKYTKEVEKAVKKSGIKNYRQECFWDSCGFIEVLGISSDVDGCYEVASNNFESNNWVVRQEYIDDEIERQAEERMDIIGQNGNDGHNYTKTMRPDYYALPSRLEDLVKDMPMFHGTATKYLIRAGKKDPSKIIEDLKKARECLDIEIERLLDNYK